MGGGKHTTQDNVTKKPRNYTDNKATIAAGGGVGGYNSEAADACMISFKAKLTLSAATKGMRFVVVPNGDVEGLQIISDGKRIGEYAGRHLNRLKSCIADGYVYKGSVDKLETEDGAVCTITGEAPV